MFLNIGNDIANVNSQPHARISLFRSEVKDRCNAVCMSTLLTFGSAPEIARVVDKQLSHYTYTFPKAGKVSSQYVCELI